LPAEGMACRIVLVVGFGLDDAHPHTGPDVTHELAAEQPPRGPFHGRLKKVEIRHDPILSRRLAAGRIRRHPEPASSGGSRMEASLPSGEKAAMQQVTVRGTGVLGSQIIFQAAYSGKDVVAYDISDEIIAKL